MKTEVHAPGFHIFALQILFHARCRAAASLCENKPYQQTGQGIRLVSLPKIFGFFYRSARTPPRVHHNGCHYGVLPVPTSAKKKAKTEGPTHNRSHRSGSFQSKPGTDY